VRRTLLILMCLCPAVQAPLVPQAKNARGSEYMVSAPTQEAVRAALSILENGGNAIDAAAAAAFAVMVTDPAMSSVGGRSQILVHLADGTFFGIDGATQAPLRVDAPANLGHGYKTAPVPGSPAALERMVLEYGTLTLREVLQPAIQLAEDGFTIKQDLHDAFRLHGETMRLYAGTRQHFFKPDGSPYSEGEVFRQPVLARTLRALADGGADALYGGTLANALVADMKAHGGLVQLDDLARYRAKDGEIVEGEYRGNQIVARGGNCDGASVVEMLQILEHFDVSSYAIDDPEYIHVVAQVLYLGNADEYAPDWLQVSKEHAARRVREIDKTRALPAPARSGLELDGETNHLSVVDADGNAVAITQSIGPTFGSKAASPDLGFFYAYSYDMNDDPIPFQREKTSQSPTMVLKDGEPYIVLGSAGSARIPGSIVRTIVNVVDHGMTLADALAARRWHIYNNVLRIETNDLSDAVIESLAGYGYAVRSYAEPDGFFARVHAVMVDPSSGVFYGAADPRDFGAAGGR
jgi:gamma-glutamyltranspeptidase/glutathione hydrolase